MVGLTLSSKLDWGSYIISIVKIASKKIGALICSVKFLFPEVPLYLCKSTIHPYMEYCCYVRTGVPNYYLELLDKLHKAEAFSIDITLVDVVQNWCNWFHFLFLVGGLLGILIDCMIFMSPFLDVTRVSMSTVSFLTELDAGILCLYNTFL